MISTVKLYSVICHFIICLSLSPLGQSSKDSSLQYLIMKLLIYLTWVAAFNTVFAIFRGSFLIFYHSFVLACCRSCCFLKSVILKCRLACASGS